ncbi:aspartyl protease family protein [Arundinibacter roseus]|uniref:PDZ domain-containing protein n=1 Tax=Arundinibacter roseus TaxID=2070510 RepID=A0A4R4KQJ6_9BACT|nr:aspartyl protease family protein [Arundinibacter roseus]TDB68879.1 PDZ domain-containing protein [Arundinibacter roseus]
MEFYILAFVSLLLCETGQSHAQILKVSEEKFGFFLDKNKKTVRVPFEFYSNLIIVPVQINASDTLRFILDTGVSATLITDPKALGNQNLTMARRVLLTGAGEGNPVYARVALDNSLSMGMMKAAHQNLLVLEEDFLHLSEYVGVPVHGIFGYEIFNNFVVTIDFHHKELVLQKAEHYTYRKRKGEQYPITIEDTKPFTNAVALVADGREHPIRVVIDTGAGHALLLDQTSREQIPLPEKVIRTQLGRGLNGVVNGSLGRIERLKFGSFELDNIVASFPDSIAFGAKIPEQSDRQGNIGCELLRRFKVTMNYQDHYMVLKPIKKRLREAFEHDMSGLEIRSLGTNLQSYFVQAVLKGSPAHAAGLAEGDEILFINDYSPQEVSISEVYKMLQKGDGKVVELLVKRDGKIFFAKFVLHRMI